MIGAMGVLRAMVELLLLAEIAATIPEPVGNFYADTADLVAWRLRTDHMLDGVARG